MEKVLRERPDAFGVTGRVVLGADNVFWVPDGTRSSGTLDLLGPECIDGYQRMALVSRLAAELSVEHLDRAVLDVRIVTGSTRELARSEYDCAHLYCNPTEPQDLLVRHPVMLRLVRQFSDDQCNFRIRRGEQRGPRREGYSIGEATTAHALFSHKADPDLAHRTLEDEGRQDLAEPVQPRVPHSVQRPHPSDRRPYRHHVPRLILGVLEQMLRARSAHHWHLPEDAPDLMIWAVARQLSFDRLHCDQRNPAAPAWEEILDTELPALTRRAAGRLARAYEKLRPNGIHKGAEVCELPYWHKLLKAAGMS
ncbi:hypothetical protein ACFVSN_16665 [Kitasatospora sp. NPDC057904]|uniref:hypothetical protein n=1 Tax=Kitasatospora sp. NPDC057904 TaxID=3346275 RepID=UPI0036DE111C